DASTQPGYVGAPLISIDSLFVPPGVDGLTVTAAATTIRGFAINRFNRGIVLDGLGHDTVAGNYLGIEDNGATAGGNTIGIGVYSPSNVIGGPGANDANVISGNAEEGVQIAAAGGNRVLGNNIGTDASGTASVPNFIGVSVESNSNTIGDVSNGRPNGCAGNTTSGVLLTGASTNVVDFNDIGTDVYGANAVANGTAGIDITGGTSPANGNAGSFNVISGNGGPGLVIETTTPGNASGADF